MKHRNFLYTALLPLLALTGCMGAVGTVVDTASARMGERIGDRIGQRAAGAVGASMNPAMMSAYLAPMFAVAMNTGGYRFEQREYRPGEYTRWVMRSRDADPVEFERAYLGNTPEGNEWWRIRWISTAPGEPADTMTIEGMFSADRSQLLRLRAKMPDDEAPQEVPVQENTFGYSRPIQMTPESIQGATVGMESVVTPAGSFNARHVRYGSGVGSALNWWLADRVPGGLVRYNIMESGEKEPAWMVELAGFGTGAKSELGVM